MWTPFKHLLGVIESYLGPDKQKTNNIAELEVTLRKHKQNFTTLLRNPVSYPHSLVTSHRFLCFLLIFVLASKQ